MSTLELLNKVAEGSAAEAFLARNEKETVLVELSRPGLSDDVELYGRFLDEARARQKLQHPHLVQLTQAGCRQDGRLYAVTESLSGLHLGSLGPVPPDQAVEYLIPLCDALGYLHERGVIHGHLRPSYVFLSGRPEAPVPKLLDMGLLLFRSTKSAKTPTQTVLVQPEYLSPERICGQRASVRSDVYGMGVLMYEVITGRPPFKGKDAEETRRMHMTAPPPQLPDEALWLQPWLNRCLAKDVGGRFGTMAQVRDALLEANMLRVTSRDGQGTVSMRAGGDEPLGIPPPFEAAPPVVRGKLEAEAKNLGPYELERLIGEGGMGQVWLARHTRLERKVAIKLLRPELVRVEQQVQRFFDEARAVNRANHPHIVEIHDFVEERELGRVWCVMEYLKGTTLKNLGREQPLSIARSVKILRQVCAALEAAHAVGVVHRDIKPDNIFLVEGRGEGDFVKVLDFGVAKLWGAREDTGHTDTGEIVGTPAYMSPEQALGQEIDKRSDLYSIGTLLYVLLAGRFPFEGVTAGQMVANIVARPPLPLPATSRSGEPITDEMHRIVERCLEKQPGNRYPNMAALAEALLPFEVTQKLQTVSDDDLIIDDTGDQEVAGDAIDIEVDEPRRRGRTLTWIAATFVLVSAVAAARFAFPERFGVGEQPTGRFTAVQGGPLEVAPPPAPKAPQPTSPGPVGVAAPQAAPASVVAPQASPEVAPAVAAPESKVKSAPVRKAPKKRVRR